MVVSRGTTKHTVDSTKHMGDYWYVSLRVLCSDLLKIGVWVEPHALIVSIFEGVQCDLIDLALHTVV